MAFYTGSSYQLNLPRTPDCNMNLATTANGQSVRAGAADLINGLKGWRSNSTTRLKEITVDAPLTPPMSTSFEPRTTNTTTTAPQYHSYTSYPTTTTDSRPSSSSMTLPPIAHLERHLSHLPPLTPPEDVPYAHTSRLPMPLPRISAEDDMFYSSSSSQQQQSMSKSTLDNGVASVQAPEPVVPGVYSHSHHHHHQQQPSQQQQQQPAQSQIEPQPPQEPQTYVVDWLDFTRTRSARFIAEKTCEMICYLWFAAPPPIMDTSPDSSPSSSPTMGATSSSPSTSTLTSTSTITAPYATPPSTPPSTLQLVATPTFVQFMQKLLETTQVSQSVIVLSLHYIYRLKEKNRWTPAQRGSEFRIAVAGLMMGNKFLDDNTYTNKTWSEVSGIELDEINRMEREFLLGVDFNLYVDKSTYEAWLNLLKGLVLAKERDCRRFGGRTGASAGGFSGSRNGAARDDRRGNLKRERERERERVYGSTGPAVRSYTTSKSQKQAYGSRPGYHRARSSSPTLRLAVPTISGNPYPPAPATTTATTSSGAAYLIPHVQTQRYSGYSSTTTTTTTAPTTTSSIPSLVNINTTPAYPSGSNSAFSSPTPRSSNPNNVNNNSFSSSSSSKRTAEAAFSPTSAGFAHVPSKRPVSMHGDAGISLRIPETSVHMGGMSASPLESLQSFERMSIGGGVSPADSVPAPTKPTTKVRKNTTASILPQTLSTAYSYSVNEDSRNRSQPLYFYTLACSPVKQEPPSSASQGCDPGTAAEGQRQIQVETQDQDDERYGHGMRKARLRYHQPEVGAAYSYSYADMNSGVSARLFPAPASTMPTTNTTTSTSSSTLAGGNPYPGVLRQYTYPPQSQLQTHEQQFQYHHQPVPRSAVTSPDANVHMDVVSEKPALQSASTGSLPHFRDDVWARPPAPANSHAYSAAPVEEGRNARGVEGRSQTRRATSSSSASAYRSPRYDDREEDVYTSGSEDDEDMRSDDSPVEDEYVVSTTVPTKKLSTHSSVSSISSTATVTEYDYHPRTPLSSSRRVAPAPAVPSAPFANAGPPGVGVSFCEGTPYNSYAYSTYAYGAGSNGHGPTSTSTVAGYSTPPYPYPSTTASSSSGYIAAAAPAADANVNGHYPLHSQSQFSSPVSYVGNAGGYHPQGYTSQYSSPQRGYGYLRSSVTTHARGL